MNLPAAVWLTMMAVLGALCGMFWHRLYRLEQGIREHRDARGDDRCWRDDVALYQLLPEGYVPEEVDSAVELEWCQRFIACRKNPVTVYVSPQRRIEALIGLKEYVAHDAECTGDHDTCDCGLFAALKAAGLRP